MSTPNSTYPYLAYMSTTRKPSKDKTAKRSTAKAAPAPAPAPQPRLKRQRINIPSTPKPNKHLALAETDAKAPPSEPPTGMMQQWSYTSGVDPIHGWGVDSVAAALSMHRRGQFQQSGWLAEDMAASPLIRHCLEILAQTFTTAPVMVVPAGRGEARRCADFIREVLPDILPMTTLRDLHRNFEMMGTSAAALDWNEYRDGKDRVWLPTIKPWQPQLTYYQQFADADSVDMGALIAQTLNKGLVRVDPGNARWLLFSQSNLKPWLQGAVNVLGEVFLGYSFNFRDSMAFQDRFGRGILKFFHPVDWKDEEVMYGAQSLLRGGGGGVLNLPRGRNGEQLFDLDLVQAQGAGFKTFESTHTRMQNLILITMLGQNMTSAGSTGGFAQARVHENGLWRKLEQRGASFGDAALTTTIQPVEGSSPKVLRQWQPRDGVLRTQLTKWIALWNFGDMDLAPYIYWDVTAPADVTEQQETAAKGAEAAAKAMQAVSTAVKSLTEAGLTAGKDFDVGYMLEQAGVRMKRVDGEATGR